MKTSQNHSRGSVKSSALNRTHNNGESSSKNNAKISKYFSTNSDLPAQEDYSASYNSQQFDSPFKKSLSEIKYIPPDDDLSKDFKTPKPIKVQKKSRDKKPSSSRQSTQKLKSKFSKSKSAINKNPLFRTTQDNFRLSDVNPDHLQMALALSKSTYAAEYPEEAEASFPSFLSPDKIPRGKTTLERFGFKSDKPKLAPEFRRQPLEVPKRKNSKFRFITPTLKSRTMEDRLSIISSKISLILNSNINFSVENLQQAQEDELYSDVLKKIKGQRSLFAANGFALAENEDTYYKKSLVTSPVKSKCGCLLKRWEDIPGREKSPVRKRCLEINEDVATISVPCFEEKVDFQVDRECISPDLFDSESEPECTAKSPDSANEFSQSLLSPSKRQKVMFSQFDTSENKKIPKYILELDNISPKPLNKVEDGNGTDSENTEELYLKSLQDKAEEEPIVTLEENKHSKESLSPRNKENGDSDSKEFVVDLTLSSSDDSSSSDEISNELNEKDDLRLGVIENKNTSTEHFDADIEMSPLYLKNSDNILGNECGEEKTDFTRVQGVLNDAECSKDSKIPLESETVDDCSALLNVTDYVNQILNQNDSTGENDISRDKSQTNQRNSDIKGQDEDNELLSSQESCSQESIVISDEELNYSSVHSGEPECDKYFYRLSDADEIPENNGGLMEKDIFSVHSALKNKYEKDIPIHNRVSQLRGIPSLARTSLSRALLEDSFNEILENTDVLKSIEHAEDRNVSGDDSLNSHCTENTCTPEKHPTVLTVSAVNTDTTPGNNLIIKTNDVTPCANYDEMDTPEITRELHNFGLKPLKRQRGVKLLKHLYDCTHPLVGPDAIELSSDEDDEDRAVKKRKKSSVLNDATLVKENNSKYDQNVIEIVGDALLENENFNELVFERKYSVRIASCKIPLQIVWHNFLSINSCIKENILLYEPLQLEALHVMMKEQTGCKFHIQDLLKFFDRKCITIRTAQGSQRRKGKA